MSLSNREDRESTELPLEILLYIFSFLDLKEIGVVSVLNKALHQFLNEDNFWKEIGIRHGYLSTKNTYLNKQKIAAFNKDAYKFMTTQPITVEACDTVGIRYFLKVNQKDTAIALKEALHKQCKVRSELLSSTFFIFKGNKLKDSDSLRDSQVRDGSCMHVSFPFNRN